MPEPVAAAEVLLCELLDTRRVDLRFEDPELSPPQLREYEAMISRRAAGEPVQRILGYAYFRNLKLHLTAETLIPRADTEVVVQAALERIDTRSSRITEECRILDLGTGSGAIAISIAQERPGCTVYASDFSEEALEAARRNVHEAEVEVEFFCGDLLELTGIPLSELGLLISNPPYIPTGELATLMSEVRDWDPHLALDGGPDGLSLYRRVIYQAGKLLPPSGELILEAGDGQAGEVARIGESNGFEVLSVFPDLAGTSRAVVLGIVS